MSWNISEEICDTWWISSQKMSLELYRISGLRLTWLEESTGSVWALLAVSTMGGGTCWRFSLGCSWGIPAMHVRAATGRRSSLIQSLYLANPPIYPSLSFSSFPSFPLPSPHTLISFSPFAFPLSPLSLWSMENKEEKWEKNGRSQRSKNSIPCQMSKNKSPEKTHSRLLFPDGRFTQSGL